VTDLEATAASRLLRTLGLTGGRSLVALDNPNPDYGPPRSPTVDITVIIVSREALDALVKALDDLHPWLEWEAAVRFGKDAPMRKSS